MLPTLLKKCSPQSAGNWVKAHCWVRSHCWVTSIEICEVGVGLNPSLPCECSVAKIDVEFFDISWFLRLPPLLDQWFVIKGVTCLRWKAYGSKTTTWTFWGGSDSRLPLPDYPPRQSPVCPVGVCMHVYCPHACMVACMVACKCIICQQYTCVHVCMCVCICEINRMCALMYVCILCLFSRPAWMLEAIWLHDLRFFSALPGLKWLNACRSPIIGG